MENSMQKLQYIALKNYPQLSRKSDEMEDRDFFNLSVFWFYIAQYENKDIFGFISCASVGSMWWQVQFQNVSSVKKHPKPEN